MTTRTTFDVVIIGAGPGGLRCAYELADSGKSILLIEKNPVVGPKVCAGGIRAADCARLHIPEGARGAEVDHLGYTTIDRECLGRHQLAQLDPDKITIRTGLRVTEIAEKHIVCGTGEQILFSYLVGADGSASLVRRYLGLSNRYILNCVQCRIPADRFIYYEPIRSNKYLYHKRLGPWYAWIFPHREHLVVGCGGGHPFLRGKTLKTVLRRWIETLVPTDYKPGIEGFPVACDYQGYRVNNIFLVGDAAGLASYRSGEGIYQALISGEETARMIVDSSSTSERMAALIAEKEEEMATFLPRVEQAFAGAVHQPGFPR